MLSNLVGRQIAIPMFQTLALCAPVATPSLEELWRERDPPSRHRDTGRCYRRLHRSVAIRYKWGPSPDATRPWGGPHRSDILLAGRSLCYPAASHRVRD